VCCERDRDKERARAKGREILYDVKEREYDEKEYVVEKNDAKECARALSLFSITLTAYPRAVQTSRV